MRGRDMLYYKKLSRRYLCTDKNVLASFKVQSGVIWSLFVPKVVDSTVLRLTVAFVKVRVVAGRSRTTES